MQDRSLEQHQAHQNVEEDGPFVVGCSLSKSCFWHVKSLLYVFKNGFIVLFHILELIGIFLSHQGFDPILQTLSVDEVEVHLLDF